MHLLINIFATYLIFLFAVLGAYYFLIKHDFLISFKMILGVLLAKIIEFILKTAFFIPRPYVVNHQPVLVTIPPIDSSFPSFHTMVAFALATIIYSKNKKLGIVLFITAMTIGLARIAANVHYPLDVISGLILGVTIGIFCDKIMTYARYHHSSPRGKNNRHK